MRNGNLFVISGPSGAGKGTLVARLLREVPDCWLSVSATTRAPREGEVDGVNYYFVTVERFMELVEADEMLEWAQYSGNLYGTPKRSVLEHAEQGYQVLLEIEVQGAAQIRKAIPESVLVFIEPPSLEELERRLRNRGTDSEEAIQRRLETARVELERKGEYDFILVNDDLDVATEELVAFVNSVAEGKRGRATDEHNRTENRRAAR